METHSSEENKEYKVIGQYTLLEEIGRGSFATVYKARKRDDLVQRWAIKAVTRNKLTSKTLENLESEISILKRIKNQNIVQLEECFKSSSHIYLVMELCEGGDLAAYIKTHRATGIDDATVRSFVGQLASALAFLRAQNVIHRDIKPQNLLLTGQTLKLADFGFARWLPQQSLADTLCGSPLYMAPEILRYEKYDAKADLWSVGAVVYEMAVGRPPYRAQNHVELLRRIERGRLKFPDERRREDPAAAGAVPASYGTSYGTPATSTPPPPVVADDIKILVRGLLVRRPSERIEYEQYFELSRAVEHGGERTMPASDEPTAALEATQVGDTSIAAERHDNPASVALGNAPFVLDTPTPPHEAAPVSPAPVPHRRAPPTPAHAPDLTAVVKGIHQHTRTSPTSSQMASSSVIANEYVLVDNVNTSEDHQRHAYLLTRRPTRGFLNAVLQRRYAPTGRSARSIPIDNAATPRAQPAGLSASPEHSRSPLSTSPQSTSPQLALPFAAARPTTYPPRQYSVPSRQYSAQYSTSGSPVSYTSLGRVFSAAGAKLFGGSSQGGGAVPETAPQNTTLLKALAVAILADTRAGITGALDGSASGSPPPLFPSYYSHVASRERSSSNPFTAVPETETGRAVSWNGPDEARVAEALVLYLRALELLSVGMTEGPSDAAEKAGEKSGEKAGASLGAEAGEPGTELDVRSAAVLRGASLPGFETAFNAIFSKAQFCKQVLSSDSILQKTPTAGHMLFEAALELSKKAALNELHSSDVEQSERDYNSALLMLRVVEDSDPSSQVTEFVRSIEKRLASLQRRVEG